MLKSTPRRLKDGKTNSNHAEQIRLVIRLIENNEEGAFAPLSNQPVIGALAMPFGGASIMAVLEHLASRRMLRGSEPRLRIKSYSTTAAEYGRADHSCHSGES